MDKNKALDMVTLISSDGKTCTNYTFNEENHFINELIKEINNIPIEVVFDCHGVLDTIEPNVQIFPEFEKYKNAVCCSYVSRNGKMREKARREIMNRIANKQIKFGVLIFGRGKKHNRYKYYDIGSKAWFCKLVQTKIFVDDGLDHVSSVKSNDKSTNVIFIRSGEENKERKIKENLNAVKNVLKQVISVPTLSDYYTFIKKKKILTSNNTSSNNSSSSSSIFVATLKKKQQLLNKSLLPNKSLKRTLSDEAKKLFKLGLDNDDDNNNNNDNYSSLMYGDDNSNNHLQTNNNNCSSKNKKQQNNNKRLSQQKRSTIRLSFCERLEQRKASFTKICEPISIRIAETARNKFKKLKRVKQLYIRRVSDGFGVDLNEDDFIQLSWLQDGDVVYIGKNPSSPPLSKNNNNNTNGMNSRIDDNCINSTTDNVLLPPSIANSRKQIAIPPFSSTMQKNSMFVIHPKGTKQEQTQILNNALEIFNNTLSPFPILEAGTALQEVRDAFNVVPRNHRLYEKKTDLISCFDYRDVNENTFPNLNHASNLKQYKLWALRRECRGLLLDRKTGNVLARRFHKFFNIGEMEETSIENLPALSNETIMLRKIDGCIVSPLLLANNFNNYISSYNQDDEYDEDDNGKRRKGRKKKGKKSTKEKKRKKGKRNMEEQLQTEKTLRWATKTVLSAELEKFINDNKKEDAIQNIIEFSWICIEKLNATPIFEWCRRDHPIVVQHQSDNLLLLAVRHMGNGLYMPDTCLREFAKAFGVAVVPRLKINNVDAGLKELANEIASGTQPRWKNQEGAVLSWPDRGIFVKVKTAWYVGEHGTWKISSSKSHGMLKSNGRLGNIVKHCLPNIDADAIPSRELLASCLSKDIDDVISLVSHQCPILAKALREFNVEVNDSIQRLHQELATWASEMKTRFGKSKSKFAKTVKSTIYIYNNNNNNNSHSMHCWSERTLILHGRSHASLDEALSSLRHDLLKYMQQGEEQVQDIMSSLHVSWPPPSIENTLKRTKKN